jgi:ribonucleoside-diphosphate reductase alpha chain
MNAVSSDGITSKGAGGSGDTHAAYAAAIPMDASIVDSATDMKFCAIDNPDCEACQ